jgi:hypothetical protein
MNEKLSNEKLEEIAKYNKQVTMDCNVKVLNAMAGVKMNAYVVTMRRYGDREKHSYVIGVFSTKQSAIIAGGLEEMYRAYKYKADIEKFKINEMPEIVKDE